jgi:colanic acid/amylovoran biosynthesis protein
MIIEIKGVQFANRGAHLMLVEIVERLFGMLPGIEFALAAHPLAPAAERARYAKWQKLPLRKRAVDLTRTSYYWTPYLRKALRRQGLVTEGDLDAVIDASGFAYGDAWSGWSTIYVAGELRRLARHGRPYIFLPQAFGPFSNARVAQKLATALPCAALVCARDTDSLAHLRSLGTDCSDRIMACPDLTIAARGDSTRAQELGIGPDSVVLVPNSRMLEEGKSSPAWRRGYTALMTALACAAQAEGRPVVVLNHAGSEDAALCAELSAMLRGVPVVDVSDPREVKGLIGAAGLVVASRYHACVSALSQGVPCIGTSWSHKYAALFSDFDAQSSVLDNCDAGRAVRELRSALARRDELSAALRQRSATLAASVEAMWARVAGILARGGR